MEYEKGISSKNMNGNVEFIVIYLINSIYSRVFNKTDRLTDLYYSCCSYVWFSVIYF